jgi:hypothetical protein
MIGNRDSETLKIEEPAREQIIDLMMKENEILLLVVKKCDKDMIFTL